MKNIGVNFLDLKINLKNQISEAVPRKLNEKKKSEPAARKSFFPKSKF